MSQEKPGFDISRMTTASKILLAGGILYLIDLFLQWNRVCVDLGPLGGVCAGANGLHGLGIINLILVLVIIAMEVVVLANVQVSMGTPQMRSQVDAGVAWVLLVFTLLKALLVDNESLSWPAFVGIILAVVIAYGGWMRWQEASVAAPPSGGIGGGGIA